MSTNDTLVLLSVLLAVVVIAVLAVALIIEEAVVQDGYMNALTDGYGVTV